MHGQHLFSSCDDLWLREGTAGFFKISMISLKASKRQVMKSSSSTALPIECEDKPRVRGFLWGTPRQPSMAFSRENDFLKTVRKRVFDAASPRYVENFQSVETFPQASSSNIYHAVVRFDPMFVRYVPAYGIEPVDVSVLMPCDLRLRIITLSR